MAAKKAPMAQMTDEHKSKETLVDRVVSAVESEGSKDEL
jgi:hypothetical protein